MSHYEVVVANEAETAALAAQVAACLPRRIVVALEGTLGAGKTRFVQGLAQAVGVDRRAVSSPTFTLVHEYDAPTPIYHFDAYRIRDDEEFLALGVEEYFQRPGWSLVEWASRVDRSLPDERLEIVIEPQGETARRFTFSARGVEAAEVLDCLRGVRSNA